MLKSVHYNLSQLCLLISSRKLCYFRPHAIFLFQNSVSSTNLNLNLKDKEARPFFILCKLSFLTVGVLIEEFQTGPM